MDYLGQCFKSVSSISYKYGKLGETVSESRTLAVKNGTTGETMTATMGYQSNYLGQMEHVAYPDGETVDYGYDAGGQVISAIGNHYGKLKVASFYRDSQCTEDISGHTLQF